MGVEPTQDIPKETTGSSRGTAFDEDGNPVGKSHSGTRVDKLKEKLAHFMEEREGRDGAFAAYVNQLKSCIGAGILGLPLAFSLAGWLYGLLLLFSVSVLNSYGMFLLAACAEKMGGHRTSWGGLARRTYPWTAPIVDFLVVFNNTGASVGYLIVISQTLSSISVDVFGASAASTLGQPIFWGSIVFWGIVAPLACLRDFSMLKWSSSIGAVSVLYLTGLTVAYALLPAAEACPEVAGPPNCGGIVVPFNNNGISIFTAIPIIAVAFLTSDSSFLAYNDLRNSSLMRMSWYVNHPVEVTATVIFTLVGLSAYLTFGDLVEGNFLLNYPLTDVPVAIAYLAISVLATASSPIKIHPSRASLLSIIYFALSKATGDNPLTWWGGAFPTFMLYVVTFLNLIIIYVLGVTLSDLGVVYAIVGAIAATGLMFYMPGFFFHKLFESDEKALVKAEKASRIRGDPKKAGESLPTMMFKPFWLRFHRDAALLLGFAGLALSAICVVALAVEYILFQEGSTDGAPAIQSIGFSSILGLLNELNR